MWGLLVASLLPFAGAAVLPLLCERRSPKAGWVATAFMATAFALISIATPTFLHHSARMSLQWAPVLGLSFGMAADGLSLVFSLLISGIGTIVFAFAAAYLGFQENRVRFFCYMLIFAGSMLGLVLSSNLIGMFVFWEFTSVSSFLLIGFWHEREASRNGAFKALLVTASGGLAMLVGFIVLGILAGSFEITDVVAARASIAASPWTAWAAGFVMLGALTKSAQFPFHLWLPSAMEAPTPVSAYLHAATMVKAGLYLVARLGPVLSIVPIWTPTLTVVGIATMTWCSYLALRQTDLKALLAFSTVSQLGLIMALLAQNEPAATAAGILHMINHGLFKGALFLLVGIIEHQTHTRDLTRLPSLARTMPRLYVPLALAAISMAGIPPLGGFISKELFLDTIVHMPWPIVVIAVFGACLTVAYCLALAVGLGIGRRVGEDTGRLHDAPTSLLWGPSLLVAGTVLLGLVPQPLVGNLLESATNAATASTQAHVHLSLFHFTPTLLVSAGAIVAGALVFTWLWLPRTPHAPKLISDLIYERTLSALEKYAQALTAAYMSGLLWRYLIIIVLTGFAAIGYVLVSIGLGPASAWPARPAQSFGYAVALIPVGAAIGAMFAPTRLSAILALGASGYSMALLFSLLGAPDLALTQIMVETVSIALFLSAFVHLPAYGSPRSRRFHPFHLVVAAVSGFGIAGLVWHARGQRVVDTISKYYVAHSAEQAGGHNVVNVILVDFRGLDTMGEITVLGIAALTCYALIKLRPEGKA